MYQTEEDSIYPPIKTTQAAIAQLYLELLATPTISKDRRGPLQVVIGGAFLRSISVR